MQACRARPVLRHGGQRTDRAAARRVGPCGVCCRAARPFFRKIRFASSGSQDCPQAHPLLTRQRCTPTQATRCCKAKATSPPRKPKRGAWLDPRAGPRGASEALVAAGGHVSAIGSAGPAAPIHPIDPIDVRAARCPLAAVPQPVDHAGSGGRAIGSGSRRRSNGLAVPAWPVAARPGAHCGGQHPDRR